jgi:hypothetical protein
MLTMTQGWLEFSLKAGDANLGQTLLRLAGLAAAAHRFAAAQPPAAAAGAPESQPAQFAAASSFLGPWPLALGPLDSFAPQADSPLVRTDADPPAPRPGKPQGKVHTEVDR